MSDVGLDPDQENQLEKEFNSLYERVEQKKIDIAPTFGEDIVRFRKYFPNAPIALLVPIVRAYSSGQLTEERASKTLGNVSAAFSAAKARLDAEKYADELGSSNAFAKKVSRIFTSSLFSFSDFVTNIAARWSSGQMGDSQLIPGVVSPNVPKIWEEDVKPALDATELGIYIDSPELRGNGWLTPKSLQTEKGKRARAYRGTIDGHAWTWGRAVGSVFLTPGSTEYNIVSGLVDAAAAFAIPAVPGSAVLSQTAKTKLGFYTLRELATDPRSGMIIPEKVSEFLNSRNGRRLVEKLSTRVNSVEKAMELMPSADVTFWRNVSSISDPNEMRKFLKDSLGLEDVTRGIGPKNIEDINLSAWDLWKYENITESESRIGKYLQDLGAKRYGAELVVRGGSTWEKRDTLNRIRTYLKSAKVDPDVRATLINRAADALDTSNGDVRNMLGELKDVLVAAAEKKGVNQEAIDRLFSRITEADEPIKRAMHGIVDGTGNPFDDGLLQPVWTENGFGFAKTPTGTAFFLPQMMKHTVTLPDLREVRRVLSPVGWITGKGGWLKSTKALQGEMRIPLSLLDSAVQYAFKVPSLITGGFVTRVLGDDAIRTTFVDEFGGGWLNPISMINIAAHANMKGDIMGATFKPELPTFASQWRQFFNGELPETYAESLLKMGQRELAEAVSGSMREMSNVERYAYLKKKFDYGRVMRSDGRDQFIKGVRFEMEIISADPIARMLASGKSITEVKDFLLDPKNRNVVEQLSSMWTNIQLDMVDGTQSIGRVALFNADGTINQMSIDNYLRSAQKRIELITQNDSRLLDMVRSGGVQDQNGNLISFLDEGKEIDEAIGVVVDDANVKLKDVYIRRKTVNDYGGPKLTKPIKLVVDTFFGHLYSKRAAYLNRSPAFRKYYSNAIERLLDDIEEPEVTKIIDNILQQAASEGKALTTERAQRVYVGRFIGKPRVADRMFDIKNGVVKTGGRLNASQVDAYAKGFALDEVKKLFYAAGSSSNFADMLRIVMPFGSAWAEVLKKYSKEMMTDPNLAKRPLMTVRAIENADPDNDGKGFIGKDPNTGQMMFYFPFGNEFSPLISAWSGAVLGGIAMGLPGALAVGAAGYAGGKAMQGELPETPGVGIKFGAPVSSFSMGFSIKPPLGPVVEMPLAWAIGDKPQFDEVMQVLFPYGERKWQEVIVPNTLQKMVALLSGPESNRQYADLKLEMVRALSATGKYDLSTQDGMKDLENDAADYAKSLYAISFVGNFAGPLRAKPEAEIFTKNGWVLAGELSKSKYDLQRRNPMNWVAEFLDTHGDVALLWLSGKSKTSFGGLDTSKEFGRFQAENKELFDKYPELAGYFAPKGDTYDMRTWLRQRESGMWERATPREMIEQSQMLVALNMYRSAVRAAGPKPNKRQRATLREYKKVLGERYPGFRRPFEIANFDDTIIKLRELANEPALSKNSAADAVLTYLNYRDEALDVALSRGAPGLGGEQNEDLRSNLRDIGETLAADFPLFERIWNWVLFNEVDPS